ncbi:SDR family NAD(P)-dependent oxidoreductase [Timonella senegalensis]|uniref:SDR family NAD(P)-dependent oxidoreductase n=1 Tax=Timonella senegalensis TaxID=1465825 RepID=UPI0002E7EF78|nr:SDR family oxidoreductase [Timonella senegalensis]
MQEFEGIKAVVTGGASGIGAAIVVALMERGAAVVSLDKNTEGTPEGAHAVVADLGSDESVRAGIADAVDVLGGLDVLVNNAGIGARGRVEDNSDEDWAKVLDVNVMGIVRTSRAAIPYLRRSEHAAIVNTSSIAGWAGILDRAVYQTSKGAVQALTMSMAADYVGEGIRVNAVNPGTVDTTMARGHINAADNPLDGLRLMEERQATGRMVSPAEVAHAVCYLASPLATSTTGTFLAVDGGMYGLRVAGKSQSLSSGNLPEWLVTD